MVVDEIKFFVYRTHAKVIPPFGAGRQTEKMVNKYATMI